MIHAAFAYARPNIAVLLFFPKMIKKEVSRRRLLSRWNSCSYPPSSSMFDRRMLEYPGVNESVHRMATDKAPSQNVQIVFPTSSKGSPTILPSYTVCALLFLTLTQILCIHNCFYRMMLALLNFRPCRDPLI